MTEKLNPLDYPFERIPYSFIYDPSDKCISPLPDLKPEEITAGRCASLSYASNASEVQLNAIFCF